jgi:hypothetical protein
MGATADIPQLAKVLLMPALPAVLNEPGHFFLDGFCLSRDT